MNSFDSIQDFVFIIWIPCLVFVMSIDVVSLALIPYVAFGINFMRKKYSRLSPGLKYLTLRTYSIVTVFWVDHTFSHILATKRLHNELSRSVLCVFASIILDFQFYVFDVLKNDCTVHHFFILSMFAVYILNNVNNDQLKNYNSLLLTLTLTVYN